MENNIQKHIVKNWRGTRKLYNRLNNEGLLDYWTHYHVKELDNNYSNFLENSLGGFASHTEIYDVAVIFDKEKGLYAIPFYETFTKIFKGL